MGQLMRANTATCDDGRDLPQSPLENNKLRLEDRAAHDWYRFILSFPAHLVRTYLGRFDLEPGQNILDPFCGTGTTVVECKKQGFSSCGIEPNPMACFASRTKTSWQIDPDQLVAHATFVAKLARDRLASDGIEDEPEIPLLESSPRGDRHLKTLGADALKLLVTNSISPLPLHKTIVLLETLEENKDERFISHERLALAKCLVNGISNLYFGPEIGVGAIKPDAAVIVPGCGVSKISPLI